MSNLKASYKLILIELRKIAEFENMYFKPIKPKLSDIELINLMILAEFKSIDSEHQLFRDIKGFEIASRIERSVYNRRKRKLYPFMEEIRMKMVEKFNEFETFFVVDSMPLQVCKISRSSRSNICKETDYAIPNKGFCASQNLHFTGINYMLFVQLMVFFRALIYLLLRFMIFIIYKILNCNYPIV